MTGIRHTVTFSSQFLGNPGIGVYLDGNSEVILAAELEKAGQWLYVGWGWRTGMLLSVGRSWWVALKESFIPTVSATGGSWSLSLKGQRDERDELFFPVSHSSLGSSGEDFPKGQLRVHPMCSWHTKTSSHRDMGWSRGFGDRKPSPIFLQ